MTRRFDAIVIGTGQAGPSMAARLAEAGMTVAVIERGKFGGTCVNTGCIPTKTLVASAHAAHTVRRSMEYGVSIDGTVRVDMKRVKARKDAVSGRSNMGVEKNLREMKNCTIFRGHARFESARTVSVNDDLLEADRSFINVGGRASIPSIPGLDQVPCLTNSSMMDIDVLPQHLIIVGGSYIGLEFAQMYRRFGSEVSIIELAPRLISREDADVSDAIRDVLKGEGIRIELNARCRSAARRGEQVAVQVDGEAGPAEILGSHLLLAVGRVPNTHDLGLEKAGVATDPRGYITVDDELRTTAPGIWALGDCNGRGAFTHTSYNDFEIVSDNLLGGKARRVTDRIQTYALFIDPPLGRCGMTEAEVRTSQRRALAVKYPMSRVGRAIEKGETEGFIKIAVDAESSQILGAAILGTGGDEVIHALLDAMYAKAPYTTIKNAMHIHPTVAEFLPTVLGQLQPLS